MPKSSRVVCHECGAQLGIVLNDRLSVEGHRVDVGPSSTITIVCTCCKTARSWETRRTA
jgi:RNase P subunit RPR2